MLLARRNLIKDKTRLALSVGGVALAVLLVLVLDAIFAGMQQQATIYIDRSGADAFVAQPGVRNMHMASSSLPTTDRPRAEAHTLPPRKLTV